MKVEWVGQHPEEGSIHAWLDGELDPSEAALLDEHVRGCDDCAARVAEARGLMAGASRVVGQLDMTPGRLIQPAATPTLDDSDSMWRLLRVTPTRAAIAAVLLVALGISLTRTRVARESEVMPAVATTPVSSEPMTAMGAPKEAPAPMKDGLLDSAISRRLADEHPARTVERAPGAAIPSPEGPTIAAAVPDTTAPQRVAAARASIRSSRDSASPPADRARVGFNSGAVVNADRLATAGQAAEAAGVRNELSARVAGVVVSAPTAAQCFLVESGAPGAQWGSVTLPMVLAFDSSGTLARVLTPGGSDTEMRAVRTAVGPDSLTLRMRRIGYSGTLALSGSGEARTGVMRSAQATAQLSEVVTTSVGEARRTSPRVDTRVPQPAAAPPAVAKTVEAPARDRNAAVGAQAQGAAGAAVAITAHVVSCTTKR